jgi:soluble lytic murein transglycosylase-like protein
MMLCFAPSSLLAADGLHKKSPTAASSALSDETRPAATAFRIPPLLSPDDQARYRRIFALQADGAWKKADAIIRDLDDPSLMGHVLYQRYMHPTAYRSRYQELKDWLINYRDHPGAQRLYALAKKRQGKAAPPPKPLPIKGLWGAAQKREAPPPPPRRSDDELWQVKEALKQIAREKRRRNGDRAEKRYWAIERLHLLTPAEEAGALGDVAFAYFFEGLDHKARLFALRATVISPEFSGDARWYGGLAAFRLGDCAAATQLFSGLAQSPMMGAWRRAGGAYWAARSSFLCGKPEDVSRYLHLAAQNGESFYGLIAQRQLGMRPPQNWDAPVLPARFLANDGKNPAIRRAIALAQIGESQKADEEMRAVLGRTDRTDWPALAALAAHLGLPASQLRVARALGDGDLSLALHYPLPDWTPDGGFSIDRALIFAIMRQESQFSIRARSGMGASGLMQVMPATASFISGDASLRWQQSRLYDPDFNMALGQQYIEHLATLPVVEGNLFMLAGAYNAGPGNLARWRQSIDYKNDPLLFIESLPSRETRDYIGRIAANLWLYRMQLGQPTPGLDAVASGAWPLLERLDDRLAAESAGPSKDTTSSEESTHYARN